ncbi:MAG TPA: hypothetical protein VKB62_09150 [Streptosporangiaceae bacterium]|nr:hypothetical protein [Streptosporangiaceae bacterium]
MRGERQLLQLGEYLVGRACQRLPQGTRADRYREWAAELPAILHDPQVRFAARRALRMLGYAADTFRATTGASAMSAALLRSPAVLMAVFVGLYVYAGPWLALGSGSAHRNAFQVIAAVVLAVLAFRGSRVARVLMIADSIFGIWVVLTGSPYSWSTGETAGRFAALVCYLVQICLLVSTPMYQRTRPGGSSDTRQPAQFLLAPSMWMVLVSAAVGIAVTVLPIFPGLRTVACRPGHPVAHFGPCLAQGSGYPLTSRFSGGIIQISHAGNVHWLNVAAPHAIQIGAFAADWGMWSLGAFLVLYLAWLNRRREYAVAGTRPAAPPAVPARR